MNYEKVSMSESYEHVTFTIWALITKSILQNLIITVRASSIKTTNGTNGSGMCTQVSLNA